MKLIRTVDAAGQVLCHDITQIIPGEFKGPRFRKGHIVQPEDIPVLLSIGKENLYVWEKRPGILHEDEAAALLYKAAAGGDDGKLLRTEGQHVQDGLRPGSGLHGVHLFLLDHQRDDAGAGQLLAFFHGHITVDGGDHHLGRAVHSQQCGAVIMVMPKDSETLK